MQATVVVVAFRAGPSTSRWLLAAALVALVVDTIHTVTLHVPVNRLLATYALDAVPAELRAILARHERHFVERVVYVSTAFVLEVVALAILPLTGAAR